MSESDIKQQHANDLYEEEGHWHVNVDAGTVFAKRMPGKYRTIKWFTMSVWLIFFLGPSAGAIARLYCLISQTVNSIFSTSPSCLRMCGCCP